MRLRTALRGFADLMRLSIVPPPAIRTDQVNIQNRFVGFADLIG